MVEDALTVASPDRVTAPVRVAVPEDRMTNAPLEAEPVPVMVKFSATLTPFAKLNVPPELTVVPLSVAPNAVLVPAVTKPALITVAPV